jgi:hypothetical protein
MDAPERPIRYPLSAIRFLLGVDDLYSLTHEGPQSDKAVDA